MIKIDTLARNHWRTCQVRLGPLRGRVLVLAIISLLSVASFPTCSGEAQYDRTAITNLVDDVSGDSIMRTIEDLQNFGSRAFYINSSDVAAAYIFERFQSMNIAVEYQEFNAGIHKSKNVIATIPGASADAPFVLFGGHYDSENSYVRTLLEGQTIPAPGADDDASGVACVVEIASVLSHIHMNNTVKFVAFGAEENGYDSSGRMAGSLNFVDSEKARGVSYEACWILDMVGYRGENPNHTVVIVNDDSKRLGSEMQMMVTDLGIDLELNIESNSTALSSDHARFWTADYPAALLIESDPTSGAYQFNPYYHSIEDTVDKLSEGQMVALTQGLVGTLANMSSLVGSDNGRTVLITATIIGAAGIAVACIYYFKWRVRRR